LSTVNSLFFIKPAKQIGTIPLHSGFSAFSAFSYKLQATRQARYRAGTELDKAEIRHPKPKSEEEKVHF
jgi:hypothetical protein